ncbi:MAG: GIY-YIG nuclease family protein [Acidobacteria bacterium]|nr:GIY-YIG nuclease family protein [Acidobacteriota bacterium]
MTLNDLLVREHVDLDNVIVLRHRPFEPGLARVLPWLAAEHPKIFNAYQRTQGAVLERSMLKLANKCHIASFLAYGAGKAIFVGLYVVTDSRPITLEQFWKIPEYQQLKEYGMQGFTAAEGRATIEQFDLEPLSFRSEWKGKLIIDWPGGERSWWRRAENNIFTVKAILENSAFDEAMPRWNDISLSWEELKVLPSRWKHSLREWRGIYYIHDSSDNKAYVGSASGSENLLGRWQNYAASGHGTNKLLRQRDPANFKFSILERVSPDMSSSDIVAQENSWKIRLSTRYPYGLNDN